MKRKNILFCAFICVVIGLVVWGLSAGARSRLKRNAIAGPVNADQPVVALTFDDGPNSRYTPQILDILYEQQAAATFFLLGEKMDGNELLIREIAASGHEIGSHTFSHPDLTALDNSEIQKEIRQTDEALKKFFRTIPSVMCVLRTEDTRKKSRRRSTGLLCCGQLTASIGRIQMRKKFIPSS